MTASRTAGKFGRHPALIPAGLHDLAHYVAGSLPRPGASMAIPDITAWGMDGNAEYGDCGVAGLNHGLIASAADTGGTGAFPTGQQVIDYYLAYTGGQDTGVVLSDFLSYVRAHGFYGHTVTAYAPVAAKSSRSIREAIWLYDFAYMGISVTEAMMAAFEAGEPWTLATLDSPVDGGHCVPAIAYDDHGVDVVTWGAIQRITWPAFCEMADEAWVLLTGELAAAGTDGHGVNLAALTADLDRLNPAHPRRGNQP